MDRKNLITLLHQSHDFNPQDLDSLVHTTASTIASKLNSMGIDEQVKYLLESGLTTVDILVRLKGGSYDSQSVHRKSHHCH
ncbi:hypothetical protein VYA_42070 (plasmid) [Vibrio alfacsensis]|uniref:hypothetical protein n=1 Tax=Vibrio sp. 04Ya108 TaxID=864336 RepID=UPI00078C4D67|nr:hypothetical protein [Vibrio sp. 04Ya108]BAU70898.1 hypothetical protein [Vibrio sp. 04Ya108]BBM67845.1 hypothetical protein VA249_44910 [Vibrio alfacsensis]BCN27015.1 hypothetical protein VYA_42070 [Vibrio alfacsensis]